MLCILKSSTRTLCVALPKRQAASANANASVDSVSDSDADSKSERTKPNRDTIVIINNANNYIDFIQGRCRLSVQVCVLVSLCTKVARVSATVSVRFDRCCCGKKSTNFSFAT